MTDFIIYVSDDGKITFDTDNFVGYAGEHNVINLIADFSGYAPLESAEYYRFVFDGFVSPALYSSGSSVSWALSKEVMVPPFVNCQICGYKKEGEEYSLIGKSEIFKLRVAPSTDGGSETSPYATDNFETAIEKCESALTQIEAINTEILNTKNSVLSTAEDTRQCSVAAKDSADTASGCETACQVHSDAAASSAVAANESAVAASESAVAAAESATAAAEAVTTALENVYTKQETDALISGASWELLTEVTVAESTFSLTIATDADGNPFKCSEIIIKTVVEPCTDNTAVANMVLVAMQQTSNYWLNRLSVVGAINQTAKRYVIAHLKCDGGYVFGEGAVASTVNASGDLFRDAFSGTFCDVKSDCIERLYIQTNSSELKIPVGTKITIYGKRKQVTE